MVNIYEFEFECLCPADRRPNVHKAMVVSERCIPVEEINAAAKEVSEMAIYQEHAGVELGRRLRATIKLVGTHDGIKITSWYGPSC